MKFDKKFKKRLNKIARQYYHREFDDLCYLRQARIERIVRAEDEDL